MHPTPPARLAAPPNGKGLRVSSWALSLTVFMLCASMTVAVYFYLDRQGKMAQQAAVSRDAALVASEIRDRLRAHAQFLRGVRAFFSANQEVSPAEWNVFARQLEIERNIPGIQAYGFAPAVDSSKLAAFVAERAHQTKYGTFKVTPQPGHRHPALPVTYIAPDTALNQSAVGFNLYSEARRREAIDLARDSDDVTLTRRIELVLEDAHGPRQAGLLMILPVFRNNEPASTVEERRRAFVGVVYAAYRMGDFMESFNYANSGALGLRIFDEDLVSTDREPNLSLLYDSGTPSGGDVVDVREMEFGQRHWHLHFTTLGNGSPRQGPLAVLLAGLMMSALLGIVSRSQTSYRERAEQLAYAMTVELRLSEERLKLAAEGTNDGIWDRDLVAGTVWHSERLVHILGFSPATDSIDLDFFLSRIHPDDRLRLDTALQKHLRDRQPYRVDYRFLKGDGNWAWFRSHGQGVWNDAGRAIRLVGSITDITNEKVSEQKIGHYRDFLATVLKFIPHPVFVKNQQHEYIAANAAFCALLEHTESEILGHVELGHTPMAEDLAARIRGMDQRVFAGAGEQVEELVLPLRRGLRTVIARKILATDPDGLPILIGTLTDVTELRQAERERLLADRQRRAILNAATEVSIIATDVQGTIKLFNRGAEKMLGYRAEEMVDLETPARLHKESEVDERARYLTAEFGYPIEGFEVFVSMARLYGAENCEWTYIRKDGTQLIVNLVVTAVREDDGTVTGYLGIATDITEQKKALAELERHQARMETIIEHIPGGVSLIDNKLHFIAANQELKKVLEFPDELFASGPPSLYEVALYNARRGDYGAGDPEELAMGVVERARTPTAHCFERTRPNGRTIEVRGTPLPDGGFVTIYTDITERKNAEAELLRHRDHLQELVNERTADLIAAKDAAEYASEAKSEFLANISHELRTPMHSVLSFANLGEDRARAAEQYKLAHFFQRIHQSGSRLLSLLNDLLDLSKLEAGMANLRVRNQDLLPVVREAVAECESWATTREIELLIDADTGPTMASFDSIRIGQVIRNLLSNAIKFSPKGSTVRIIFSEARLSSGDSASEPGEFGATRIEIRDQGPGIPEGELEQIFDKFVQSSKTKTGAGGSGLGLAICREIVLAHRGTIRACNNPTGGASLIVTLPQQLLIST